MPEIPHAALVVGPGWMLRRRLGQSELLAVVQIGSKVELLYDPLGKSDLTERWDRQIRALGRKGQATLQGAHVAIVGLGGTGSVVARPSLPTSVSPNHSHRSRCR